MINALQDNDDPLYLLIADKLSNDARRQLLAQLVFELREGGGDAVKKMIRELVQVASEGEDVEVQD